MTSAVIGEQCKSKNVVFFLTYDFRFLESPLTEVMKSFTKETVQAIFVIFNSTLVEIQGALLVEQSLASIESETNKFDPCVD